MARAARLGGEALQGDEAPEPIARTEDRGHPAGPEGLEDHVASTKALRRISGGHRRPGTNLPKGRRTVPPYPGERNAVLRPPATGRAAAMLARGGATGRRSRIDRAGGARND